MIQDRIQIDRFIDRSTIVLPKGNVKQQTLNCKCCAKHNLGYVQY